MNLQFRIRSFVCKDKFVRIDNVVCKNITLYLIKYFVLNNLDKV